jgi:hypothetical protein
MAATPRMPLVKLGWQSWSVIVVVLTMAVLMLLAVAVA